MPKLVTTGREPTGPILLLAACTHPIPPRFVAIIGTNRGFPFPPNHSPKEVIRLDKSEQAYRNAAIAVAAGTASELQKQLNSDMAKVAGQMGRDARDAEKKAGQK